jgi:hypothetical protein
MHVCLLICLFLVNFSLNFRFSNSGVKEVILSAQERILHETTKQAAAEGRITKGGKNKKRITKKQIKTQTNKYTNTRTHKHTRTNFSFGKSWSTNLSNRC